MKNNKNIENLVFKKKYLKTSKIEVVRLFPPSSKKYKNRNKRKRKGKERKRKVTFLLFTFYLI